MTVKELINSLVNAASPDAEVILQKDIEGNGFALLDWVDTEAVCVRRDGVAFPYSLHWTAEEAGMTKEKWAKVVNGPKCVLLVPVD